MRTRYLTRRGSAFVFQIRLPRALDPDFSLSPIRVTIGPASVRSAREAAGILSGAARLAFERLRQDPMTKERQILGQRLDVLTGAFNAAMQTMRGMAALAHSTLPDDVRPEMVDATLTR